MRLLRFSRESVGAFAVGDLLVVIAFVLLGEFSHGVLPWTVPLMVAETTATFLLGWIVVAPLVWAYQRPNRSVPLAAVRTGVIAWIGAAAVANLLRSSSFVHGNASLSFYLVSVLAGGTMLAIWRFFRVRSIQA